MNDSIDLFDFEIPAGLITKSFDDPDEEQLMRERIHAMKDESLTTVAETIPVAQGILNLIAPNLVLDYNPIEQTVTLSDMNGGMELMTIHPDDEALSRGSVLSAPLSASKSTAQADHTIESEFVYHIKGHCLSDDWSPVVDQIAKMVFAHFWINADDHFALVGGFGRKLPQSVRPIFTKLIASATQSLDDMDREKVRKMLMGCPALIRTVEPGHLRAGALDGERGLDLIRHLGATEAALSIALNSLVLIDRDSIRDACYAIDSLPSQDSIPRRSHQVEWLRLLLPALASLRYWDEFTRWLCRVSADEDRNINLRIIAGWYCIRPEQWNERMTLRQAYGAALHSLEQLEMRSLERGDKALPSLVEPVQETMNEFHFIPCESRQQLRMLGIQLQVFLHRYSAMYAERAAESASAFVRIVRNMESGSHGVGVAELAIDEDGNVSRVIQVERSGGKPLKNSEQKAFDQYVDKIKGDTREI